jgi:Ca2+-binding RTX toxin-like protein
MHAHKFFGAPVLLLASLALAGSASAQAVPGTISATFASATGVLTVSGDDASNTIVISKGDGGRVLVNDGSVSIQGGTPSINNTSLIQVLGQGGSDRIVLEQGRDGFASIQVDGGDGEDVLEVNGSNLNEIFSAAPNSDRVRVDRSLPTTAPYVVDIGTTEQLVLKMDAADDTFNGSNGLATLIKITVDAGSGNDVINGGDGAEIFIGGPGKDIFDGNRGNDVAFMGDGDDVFIWDPGDGSDTIEGQDGQDTMRFNGANVSENIDVSANGGRVRFFRNVANIVMDLDDVETIEFNALGGADNITVNDLSGTDATEVTLDLAATLGGSTGDDAADTVTVNGTNGNDTVELFGNRTVTVTGLPAGISVLNPEVANDSVLLQMQAGNDSVDASRLSGSLVKLTLDGGVDNDSLVGSKGADVVRGGDDTMVGADGDVYEGDGGNDRVVVTGLNVEESYSASANAGRVRLERSVPTTAPFSIDIGTSESLVLDMRGGNDTFNGGSGLAALIQLTVDGGSGNDVLNGGDGADVFLGGSGKDTIDGNRGNDVAFMGDGNDVFIWDPGDGSDVVEGQDGRDTLLFNGANVSENIDVAANGGRVRFFRNVANIVMDLDDVEAIDFNALGGADNMVVNDLSGTDTTDVLFELAATLGGFDGDGAVDAVVVNGTNGNDTISVSRTDGNVVVSGLPATVRIGASEATDTLTVNGLGGDDTFDASGLPAGHISLTVVP